MSQEYDNTNSGALFKNDRKETDKHPDYKGSLNVDGSEFWLSSWIKQDRNGKTYMSLSIQPKEEQRKPTISQRAAPARQSARTEMDDEIPF